MYAKQPKRTLKRWTKFHVPISNRVRRPPSALGIWNSILLVGLFYLCRGRLAVLQACIECRRWFTLEAGRGRSSRGALPNRNCVIRPQVWNETCSSLFPKNGAVAFYTPH